MSSTHLMHSSSCVNVVKPLVAGCQGAGAKIDGSKSQSCSTEGCLEDCWDNRDMNRELC